MCTHDLSPAARVAVPGGLEAVVMEWAGVDNGARSGLPRADQTD